MTAKELMIGDWIKYNNQILRYSGVFTHHEPLNEKSYTRLRCMWNDNEGLEVPEEKVEPIPLTEEILKKKGFVRDKYIKRYNRLYNHFEVYVDFVHNEILIWNKDSIDTEDRYFSCKVAFKYPIQVHQFQHILRLAGLNELADNLKV